MPMNKTLKLYKGLTLSLFDDPVTGDIEYILRDNGKILSKTFNRASYIYQKNLTDSNVLDAYEITRHLVDHDIAGLVNVCKAENELMLFKANLDTIPALN